MKPRSRSRCCTSRSCCCSTSRPTTSTATRSSGSAVLLALTRVTVAVVSHDYDFIEEVCTDVVHYDNGGKAGRPCQLVYYPMTFKEFQKIKPEIAGLPTVGKALGKGGAKGDDADALADGLDALSVDSGERAAPSRARLPSRASTR